MPQTDARQEQNFGSTASYIILEKWFNMGKMKIALSFLYCKKGSQGIGGRV